MRDTLYGKQFCNARPADGILLLSYQLQIIWRVKMLITVDAANNFFPLSYTKKTSQAFV